MKAKRLLNPAVFVILALLAGPAAADWSPADYILETYASYYNPTAGPSPWQMTFDEYGNLYVSHREDDSIYRIDPNGNAQRWIDGLDNPRGMVWGGGTEYGEYLYVAAPGTSRIYRIDLDGNVSTFATVSNGPSPLALDRNGGYGGLLYTSTRVNDHIEKVLPTGQTEWFSDFPYDVSGGVGGIAFDPGLEYGGFMYVACKTNTPSEWDGLFRLDVDGQPTRFGSTEITWADQLAFDATGLMFDRKLYVLGRIVSVPAWSIYQVSPDGTVRGLVRAGQTHGIYTFGFGPDSAMYVVGYSGKDSTVIITRISLAPPEVLAANRIKMAITKKTEALEKIEAALQEELAAFNILEELLDSGEFGDLTMPDILKAKSDIRTAMLRERLCKADVVKSIRKLEDALDSLGFEVEPNTLPDSEHEEELLRADLNADGVINQRDLAILAAYWLKSYSAP